MRNAYLKDKVAADIDARVARVLNDLGTRAPPLRLDVVRQVLELDRQFYTKDDPGFLDQLVHKMKVAGKQVLHRPLLIFDVIKKLDLRALYLPDSKRILLDRGLAQVKLRWSEAHEIGHDLIPWHHEVMLGDTRLTLSPACHEKIEAEANFAAGRLLFLQDHFVEVLRGSPLCIDRIKSIAVDFGNTITTTLWRSVEHLIVPAIGLVSCHPHRVTGEITETEKVKYFVRSRTFQVQFSKTNETSLFETLQTYCGNRSGGTLGQAEVVLADDNGQDHIFVFETFFNRYEALTLGMYQRPRPCAAAT